jgi:uncharacterized LabA/DUF88 family protein
MRTIIYVDGFNFYYGSLKKTNYKWLNLNLFFKKLLKSHHKITKINYFTANLKKSSHAPNAQNRQKAYLSALKTLPNFEIHLGRFVLRQEAVCLAQPPHKIVNVLKYEEKGSDVNFSVHLLNDATHGRYDCAIIVTNDSDMAEAMRLVKAEFPDKKLGLIAPGNSPVNKLKKHADFIIRIKEEHLRDAQFPNSVLRTGKTPISKPVSW